MHRHGRHDATRDPIGIIPMTPLLMREHETFFDEGSLHVARGARRKTPTHTIVGISTVTPSDAFATGRSAGGF